MTSTRRRQRAAQLTGTVAVVPEPGQNEHGVPLELYDLDAAPWRSSAATAAWYQEQGIGDPRQVGAGDRPAHRLGAAIAAFAVATGRATQPGGMVPDHRWLAAVGLDRVKQQCTRRRLATVTGRG